MNLFEKILAAWRPSEQEMLDFPELLKAEDLVRLEDGTFALPSHAKDPARLSEATPQPVEYQNGEVDVLMVRALLEDRSRPVKSC